MNTLKHISNKISVQEIALAVIELTGRKINGEDIPVAIENAIRDFKIFSAIYETDTEFKNNFIKYMGDL